MNDQSTSTDRYVLTYHANGATSGSVPPSSEYAANAIVTVSGNTGELAKASSVFSGWNTKTTGTGTPYAPGRSFTMKAAGLTLYASWKSAAYDIYVVSGDTTIEGYRLDASGALTPIGAAAPPSGVKTIAANAAGTRLYASKDFEIQSYSIESDGSLTSSASITVSGETFNEMVITPFATDPNYLYTANSPIDEAICHGVSANGSALNDLVATATGFYWASYPFMHPKGKVLYFQTTSGNFFVWYSINPANGSVSFSGNSDIVAAESNQKSVAMNPDCTYFYVAGSDGVYYYDADPSNGELSNPRQVPTAYTPKAAAVHASGSWLYVSGDDYAIHRYSIENGTPSSDVTVSSYSSQFLKSVSAEYLVSYSTKDNAVVLWRVDSSDGTITQAGEISVDSPSWVDFRLAP